MSDMDANEVSDDDEYDSDYPSPLDRDLLLEIERDSNLAAGLNEIGEPLLEDEL